MRGGLLVGDACYGAHQSLAIVADFVVFGIQYQDEAVALVHGGGYALLQAVLVLVAHHHFVYHHFDVVVLVAVELHAVYYLAYLSVYTDIQVAFLAYLLEEFLVMPFTGTYQRGKDVNTLADVFFADEAQNLLFGVFNHLFARQVRIGYAGTGKEQTQVVVYFGGGTHGGAWILVGGFLFDGDDGAKAGNLVYIRSLHASQKVACIGRKGLDVSALAFGKDGVECQGRLPASAQAGNHGQAIAGDGNVDVLQVVHTGTVYLYGFFFFCHKECAF